MNKRIWSIAVAVAMLLSMLCSVFFVSAEDDASQPEAGPIVEEVPEAEQLNNDASEEVVLSQKNPVLGASESGAPALAITSDRAQIALGGEMIVDVALKNYAGGWATFGVELEYPANLELKSYENKLDLTLLGENVSEEDQPFFNIDSENRTIKAYWLRIDGANIPAGDADLPLLQLTFKAAAEGSVNLSAGFIAESVAGYPNEDGGESVLVLPENGGYVAEDAVFETPVEVVKKSPYLTMRAKDGSSLTSVSRGEKVQVIVTLNDFYSGWMILSLSCKYDTDLFEIADPETDIKNLGSFPGEMLHVIRDNDPENPLLVTWVNSDMQDHLLEADGEEQVYSADILELTLTAKGETDAAVISSGFMEGGNVSNAVSPDEALTEENYIPQATETVTVKVERPPYLTISASNTSIKQGDEIVIDVDIHNFTTGWTVLSLLAEFDSDVFEVAKDDNGQPKVLKTDAFPDGAMEIIAVDRSGATDGYPLGVTLLSTKGTDVALKNGAKEGTIMKICLKAKTDAVLQETQFPISVAFTPGGNISQEINGMDPLTTEHYDQPAEDEALIVEVQGMPSLSIRRKDGLDTAINQGESVTFVVSVDDFTGAWDVMSLMMQFDYNVFTMDADKDGAIDDGLVLNMDPFVAAPNDALIRPEFMAEYNENRSCPLAVCWFNGSPLRMKANSQDILEFTLIARENVDLEKAMQSVVVGFIPDGNMAGGKPVQPDEDYVATSAPIEVEVNEIEPEVSVHIEWGAMTFEFSYGTWNTEEHIWEGRGWTCVEDANKITVTNLGATNVSAGFAFKVGEGFEGLNGAFFSGESKLTEGDPVYVPVASDPKIITFQLDGLPSNEDALSETPQAVGVITITIDIAQEVPIE